MPSTDTDPNRSRRRLLAALGSAATAGIAGCTGRLPGTGAREVDTETTVEADRVLWEYPQRNDDQNGIGYAEVAVDRRLDRANRGSALALTFNSTIGGIAASEPYRGFRPDWFRFSVRPPRSYENRLAYRLLVEPPGQWEGFSAYYDIENGVRRAIVELQNVDTRGTIEVPAIFEPSTNTLPDQLTCAFTVQASRSGLLGETVRAEDAATLDLGDT